MLPALNFYYRFSESKNPFVIVAHYVRASPCALRLNHQWICNNNIYYSDYTLSYRELHLEYGIFCLHIIAQRITIPYIYIYCVYSNYYGVLYQYCCIHISVSAYTYINHICVVYIFCLQYVFYTCRNVFHVKTTHLTDLYLQSKAEQGMFLCSFEHNFSFFLP